MKLLMLLVSTLLVTASTLVAPSPESVPGQEQTLKWFAVGGSKALAAPTKLLWAATLSGGYTGLEVPSNHVRIVALRATVQIGPIIVRSQSHMQQVDLLSADPVSMHISETSVGDVLDHAAETLGVGRIEHDDSIVPSMIWRLVPVAGKTWADVQGPADVELLRDDG
ncbi:MAG: hypothetical protein H6825_04125 [Planctomycetes bacterium]|nr:hypothetical protein [Planctomycetota bacterium]